MKLTILIIGLALAGIVGVQSALLVMFAPFSSSELQGAGSTGIIVALLLIIAAAFAMSVLKVSAAGFAVASALAFAIGRSTTYHDLAVWGVVAGVLAALSLFADNRAKATSTRPPFEFGSYQQAPAVLDPGFEKPIDSVATTATVPNAVVRPGASSPARDLDTIERLERLAALRAAGTLSDEEFAAMKATLMTEQGRSK